MNQIIFLKTEQPVLLLEFLQNQLHLKYDQALFLLQIGAIYRSQNHHPHLKPSEVFFKRETDPILLEPGAILRCHQNPRRFPTYFNWSERVVFENEDFIVINKPPGLPCQPSLDNKIENVVTQLSLFKKQNLFITHRLDVGTSGLLALAKTKEFQVLFNKLLESRLINKYYDTYTQGPSLHLGLKTHWMQPHPRSPKTVSGHYIPGWKPCELVILATEELKSISNSRKSFLNYYRIQLLTGRTHQIRAQLSSMKNFICGDILYGGEPIATENNTDKNEIYSLQCSQLEFQVNQNHYNFEIPRLIPPSLT